jgi:hypothetical protein
MKYGTMNFMLQKIMKNLLFYQWNLKFICGNCLKSTNYLKNEIYKHQKIRIWNWYFEFKCLDQFIDHHSTQYQLFTFLKTNRKCIINVYH